jgi:transcriptional regulator
MRYTPHFLLTDEDEVKRVIRENPWATIVSSTDKGIVASHYPVILEENVASDNNGDAGTGISIVSHVGRPDERAHELGQHEVLVIIQGPHGYISPGWYENTEFIPTWNHVTAHLYGTPEILSDDENFEVLGNLVDHFEKPLPDPVSLEIDENIARHVATGTVGIRVRISRFDARLKLSQNKSPAVVGHIIEALEAQGPYSSQPLADEMSRFYEKSRLDENGAAATSAPKSADD